MVKKYACKKLLISCGPRSITGYAVDSFLGIAPTGEGTQKETGCDGETVRSLDPDKTYKITLTIQQTSDDMGFFQRKYELDRETGLGDFPILVRNLMGGEVFSAPQCWVANSPERGYAKTAGTREITLDTGEGSWNDAMGV